MPYWSDVYHAYYLAAFGAVPPALQNFDWRTSGELAISDLVLGPVRNSNTGITNLSTPRPFNEEHRLRTALADLGFKPDANSWVKGGLITELTFSRAQDIEAVAATRGHAFPALDPLVQSMVTPYTIGTITVPGAGIVSTNIPAALGISNIHGWTRPYPWPRVLNGLRIWNVSNNTKHWPRGHVIASDSNSGPNYQVIQTDGTFLLLSSTDPQITPLNNLVNLQGGSTYRVEVGHVESAIFGLWRHQRWPGWTWKPGDGITY